MNRYKQTHYLTPKEARVMLLLIQHPGITQRGAAEALGCSKGNINQLTFRVRQRFGLTELTTRQMVERISVKYNF